MTQILEDNMASYRIYVLYCWQDGTDVTREPNWLFSVERAGEDAGRRGFASLTDAFAYLNLDLVGRLVKLPQLPAAKLPRPPGGNQRGTRDEIRE